MEPKTPGQRADAAVAGMARVEAKDKRLRELAEAIRSWDKRYPCEGGYYGSEVLVPGPEWVKWVELARGDE